MPQKAANKKNCAKATEASRHFAEANLQKLSTGYQEWAPRQTAVDELILW